MTDAVQLPGNPWDPFEPSRLSSTHGVLALRVLRYFAAYTRLNDNAGWFLRGWYDDRPDAAGERFELAELGRLGDDRMVKLVRWAAADLGTAADMSAFKSTFKKVKTVRDHLAHAMFINLLESGSTPSFGVPYYYGNVRVERLEDRRSSVSDRILVNRERELLWLLEVVEWLAQEFGYRMGPGSLNREMTQPEATPN